MINTQDATRIEHATAYDTNGDKVGKVDQVYLDDRTGEPSFVTVTTGFFGTSQSFVPLQRAALDGDDLRLGYEKDMIKDAPRVEADQHITPAEEDEIYRYYGLAATDGRDDARTDIRTDMQADGRTDSGIAGEGHAESRRTSADDVAVTRSEERLEVGKESEEAGRVRLRKYTTTDTETVSVPVAKEKLVVERNPVDGDASAAPIDQTGEQVEEITLREEHAVVDKETVAVEEVRVGKEQVTEQEQVSAEVRKEHVEVEGEDDARRA